MTGSAASAAWLGGRCVSGMDDLGALNPVGLAAEFSLPARRYDSRSK